MGAEFQIDNLEDMCRAMCDNVEPEQEADKLKKYRKKAKRFKRKYLKLKEGVEAFKQDVDGYGLEYYPYDQGLISVTRVMELVEKYLEV